VLKTGFEETTRCDHDNRHALPRIKVLFNVSNAFSAERGSVPTQTNTNKEKTE
jgi:hypothetical protein